MIPLHQHSGMQPMQGWVYIYALCHPITRTACYVGQSWDPATRYIAHLHDDGTSEKCKWVARLRANRKKPLLNILAIVPVAIANEMEKLLIALLDLSTPLFNTRLMDSEQIPGVNSPPTIHLGQTVFTRDELPVYARRLMAEHHVTQEVMAGALRLTGRSAVAQALRGNSIQTCIRIIEELTGETLTVTYETIQSELTKQNNDDA